MMSKDTPKTLTAFQLPDRLEEFIHTPPFCHKQPRVLISACLAGENVRYDGKEKGLGDTFDILKKTLELVHHCPEMAAGMGVPRAPIQWVQNDSLAPQLQWVERPGEVVDYPLQARAEEWCQRWSRDLRDPADELSAAILKARSPSCGNGTTPLMNKANETLSVMDGLFTATLKRFYPQLVVIDESYFAHTRDVHWFVLGLYLHKADKLYLHQADSGQLSAAENQTLEELRSLLPWEGHLEPFLQVNPDKRAACLDKLAFNSTLNHQA